MILYALFFYVIFDGVMLNKSFVSILVLSLCTLAIAAGDIPPSRVALPPLDGIKHGASRGVFDRLVSDHRSHTYKLYVDIKGAVGDYAEGHCMNLLNGFKQKAVYAEPKFVTDGYGDARLDSYKRLYRDAQNSLSEDKTPGFDWFGGSIRMESF